MMKSQVFLRFLLLLPYLAWGLALLFTILLSKATENSLSSNAVFEITLGVVAFYTIGILVWGIPYTVLAVGLALWSIKKPAALIYKVFLFSPFLLSILTLPEIALIVLWPPQAISSESMMDILSYALVTIVPMLVIGYGFVGIGGLLYKIMEHLKMVNIEGETQ